MTIGSFISHFIVGLFFGTVSAIVGHLAGFVLSASYKIRWNMAALLFAVGLSLPFWINLGTGI